MNVKAAGSVNSTLTLGREESPFKLNISVVIFCAIEENEKV